LLDLEVDDARPEAGVEALERSRMEEAAQALSEGERLDVVVGPDSEVHHDQAAVAGNHEIPPREVEGGVEVGSGEVGKPARAPDDDPRPEAREKPVGGVDAIVADAFQYEERRLESA
jgi:hypothetical protein